MKLRMNTKKTNKFVRACSFSELKEKGRIKFEALNGGEAALFFTGGKVYAVDNVCPHNHTPKIHLGIIEGNNILCPVHLYKFNLKTGKNINCQTCNLPVYEVRIEGDDVFIEEPKSNSFNFDF